MKVIVNVPDHICEFAFVHDEMEEFMSSKVLSEGINLMVEVRKAVAILNDYLALDSDIQSEYLDAIRTLIKAVTE